MNTLGWQHYRSLVNEFPAVFTVNLDNVEQFRNRQNHKILQFCIDYQGGEDGLPTELSYNPLLDKIFICVTQIISLENVFFAGYFVAGYQAKLHFYCADETLILDALQQFDFVRDIQIQEDPNWDIYFDFLLASPLELKMNTTEELLNLLKDSGRNLSDMYLVEHTFHFDQEEKMFPFMDELSLGNYSFITLKYANQPIQEDENESPYYMVKLEQELSFDNPAIFEQVESFEQLANQFEGEYIGWECDALNRQRNQFLQ
ncbi:TIGR01619 family protein [Rodentibacter caecimuris]|uniref:TIGR01619 family protein n=1 Tax=Rodentibacter caecimuris TaxID=1796644 RepID=A0ABX3KXY6_9PAST|nr:TIGR01619 family protein [Rodentibacter heylii]